MRTDKKYGVRVMTEYGHGVQRWIISVVNFSVFLRLIFFASLLLYVTIASTACTRSHIATTKQIMIISKNTKKLTTEIILRCTP